MTLPDLSSAQWQRRFRLLSALALVIIALLVVWKLLTVLLPFLLSGIVAYLLLPLVNLAERYAPGSRRWPRAVRAAAAGLATLLVILIALGVVALALSQVLRQTIVLADYAPNFLVELQEIWRELQAWYEARVPANVRGFIDPRLADVQNALAAAALNALQRLVAIVRSGLSLIISLAAVPLILFYLLYNPSALGHGALRLAPASLRDDLAAISRLAGEVVGSYLRVQLLMALLIGVVVTLALWALGVPRPLILGVIAGLAELVPVVGATISLVVAAVITLLSEPVKVPIVIALYLVVQTLQNVLLSPRFQGAALGLHPLTIVLALAIAGAFLGFWGILVAAPLTAAGYRVLRYVVQEWSAAANPEPSAGQPPGTRKDIPPDSVSRLIASPVRLVYNRRNRRRCDANQSDANQAGGICDAYSIDCYQPTQPRDEPDAGAAHPHRAGLRRRTPGPVAAHGQTGGLDVCRSELSG